MIFTYTEFLGVAEERIFRPMIPITFIADSEIFNTYALIDSGSDYTILPIEIAARFNFNLANQPQHLMQAAGGQTFTMYKSPLKVEHLIRKNGFRDFKWQAYVYFAESSQTTLLGFKSFLENFEIKLDGKNKEVKIILS